LAQLPVKRGLSSPAVTSIPEKWSQQWFRYFIDQFLSGADLRNASGSGITVSGNVSGNNTTTGGQTVTINLSPIAPNTVLGNVTGVSATPTAINQVQLTSLINIFSPTLSGAVPNSGGGTVNFLRADGTWTTPPTDAPIPDKTVLGNVSGGTAVPVALNQAQLTGLINVFTASLSGAVPASSGGTTTFLRADGTFAVPPVSVGANPTASVGLSAVNGVATTFLRSDGAPALSQAIVPTWTGVHVFSPASGVPVTVNATTNGGVSVQGATGVAALIELAANANVIGTSSIAVGQDGSGDATLFQRANRQLYFGTNALIRMVIPAAGGLSINAATSGNSLSVTGNNASIAALVTSGLSSSTGGADFRVSRAGSTINQAGQGPNVFILDSTNSVGYYLQTSGGQFELWSSVGGGPTLTQILKILTTGGIVHNVPTSGTSMDITGVAGGNTVFVHASTTSANSFGLRIDGGTTSADYGLLVQSASAATEYFRVQGDGGIRFGNVPSTTTAPAAGGAGALPATPAGYATFSINGVSRKIAFY